MVYGARRWFEGDLGKPQEVSEAVAGWRNESEPLKDFIEDCCEVHADAQCKIGELRKAYAAHCEQNGTKPLDSRDFNELMEERGFKRDRKKAVCLWVGLMLWSMTA